MRSLKRRVRLLLCAVILCAAVFIIMSVFVPVLSRSSTDTLLPACFCLSILLILFLLRSYKRLITARLIVENQILHICPAVIDTGTLAERAAIEPGTIEVYISCFGILLGSSIIRFNQDGIQLKRVEIGRDYISLIYGTEDKTQGVRLLHAVMEASELSTLVEKLYYETGIVPYLTTE